MEAIKTWNPESCSGQVGPDLGSFRIIKKEKVGRKHTASYFGPYFLDSVHCCCSTDRTCYLNKHTSVDVLQWHDNTAPLQTYLANDEVVDVWCSDTPFHSHTDLRNLICHSSRRQTQHGLWGSPESVQYVWTGLWVTLAKINFSSVRTWPGKKRQIWGRCGAPLPTGLKGRESQVIVQHPPSLRTLCKSIMSSCCHGVAQKVITSGPGPLTAHAVVTGAANEKTRGPLGDTAALSGHGCGTSCVMLMFVLIFRHINICLACIQLLFQKLFSSPLPRPHLLHPVSLNWTSRNKRLKLSDAEVHTPIQTARYFYWADFTVQNTKRLHWH